MDRRDDERLRALYIETRRAEDQEALQGMASYDELMARRRQAKPRARSLLGGFRGRSLAYAAIAAVLLSLAFFYGLRQDEAAAPEHREAALVAEADAPEMIAEAPELQRFDERWEELLEFADELWEWESPTEYLL